MADFCRKCTALSDAQQRAGDRRTALSSLGHSVALLLQLGFDDPVAWRPLVQACVRLQAEQPAPASQGSAAAAPPARRGRGAAGKKAAEAAAAEPSSSGGNSSSLMLVDCLLAHAEQLPEGSLAAVVELELQCWAAQQGSNSGVGQLASHLLQVAFPPLQQPLQHAGVLLALHQLGLPAEDGSSGPHLLERAEAVLHKVGGCQRAVFGYYVLLLPALAVLDHSSGILP